MSILGSNWGQPGLPAWGPGDATGDSKVDLSDLSVLGLHWSPPDFRTWPSGEQRGSRSTALSQITFQLALDAILERYGVEMLEESATAELRDDFWDGFIDDFVNIFSELAA